MLWTVRALERSPPHPARRYAGRRDGQAHPGRRAAGPRQPPVTCCTAGSH